MFSMSKIIKLAICPERYIWVDVILIKETPKAFLIEFDSRKAWFPKAWVVQIKKIKHNRSQQGEAISIKITEYHLAKKFF